MLLVCFIENLTFRGKIPVTLKEGLSSLKREFPYVGTLNEQPQFKALNNSKQSLPDE